jgi:hypothetical protein
MGKLALVYGLRLLPADEIEALHDAPIDLKDGRKASAAMHLLEGENEEELRRQLERSLDAFFEFYPQL